MIYCYEVMSPVTAACKLVLVYSDLSFIMAISFAFIGVLMFVRHRKHFNDPILIIFAKHVIHGELAQQA